MSSRIPISVGIIRGVWEALVDGRRRTGLQWVHSGHVKTVISSAMIDLLVLEDSPLCRDGRWCAWGSEAEIIEDDEPWACSYFPDYQGFSMSELDDLG